MKKQAPIHSMCFITILFIFCFRHAIIAGESFRNELDGSFAYGVKRGSDYSNIFIEYSGRYSFYFSKVALAAVPYEEAAFLSKSSKASLIIGDYKEIADILTIFNDGTIMDINYFYWGGCVKYVFSMPVFIEAGYYRIDMNKEISGAVNKSLFNVFSLGLGYYFLDNLTMEAAYDRPDLNSAFYGDSGLFSGKIKYVLSIDPRKSANMEGRVKYYKYKDEMGGNLKIYSFAGDFYVLPQLGIGCEIVFTNCRLNDFSFKSFAARVKWYVIRNIGFGLKYDPGINNDGYIELSATGRI